MTQEVKNEWANACAAQIINLHQSDEPTTMKFLKISSLVQDVIRLALMEEREKLLRPSGN